MNEDPSSFWGQWLGLTDGTNRGFVTLTIEPGRSSGRLQFADFNKDLPSFSIEVAFRFHGDSFTGELNSFWVYVPTTGDLIPAGTVPQPTPSGRIPTGGEVRGKITGDVIECHWQTNIETRGFARLNRSTANKPAAPALSNRWQEFKSFVSENCIGHNKFIYRGQQDSTWRLQTSFHRANRNDLVRYDLEDIPRLQKLISVDSDYRYNLKDPFDHGAFLSLAQHHGFPTPLLDWTESPYIAAYFAYESVPKTAKTGSVRVFVFDTERWMLKNKQNHGIRDPNPSISIKMLLAYNNPRAIPQQSVATFSTVVDMEGFIDMIDPSSLVRIDLPVSDRNQAMNELRTMGITASSLFPGLDGICRSLKEQCF